MEITVDENIIYAPEAFSELGKVKLLQGREFTKEKIIDSDAIVVRSITNINKELLEGTNVKFVGTATIGDDHIDKEYLLKKGISFSNAKGCNAQAVTEYVFSAIAHLTAAKGLSLAGKSIGVIGVGNIGSRVAMFARALGMKVIKNDPPRQKESGSKEFRPYEEALQADIITFHVPLNIGGEFNTFHLLNECNLDLIKSGAILINSSRGAVIDNAALKKRLKKKKKIFTILDVWENEPGIDLELLKLVDIATPHIAGYSYEGKVNGTFMIYEALCRYFGFEKKWRPPENKIENNTIKISSRTLEGQLYELFSSIYSIMRDDKNMRKMLKAEDPGKVFDSLRKEYPLRRELKNYRLEGTVSLLVANA